MKIYNSVENGVSNSDYDFDEFENGENMNEIQVNAVVQQQPVIVFKDYSKLLSEATLIAEKLNEMEVNEDNIKEQKKLLAKVNKSIKELNDRRIAIKKEILEPYEMFNSQVKEIESVIKEADTRLRNQAREIEEAERVEKKKRIHEIWDLRMQQYDLAKMIEFEDWIQQSHLNKSMSMNKVEDEMVIFLEAVEKDLGVINGMDNSKEIMTEYLNTLSIAEAIEIVNSRIKAQEKQAEMLEKIGVETDKKYMFILNNEKDMKFAKMLLNENEIKFEIKEI